MFSYQADVVADCIVVVACACIMSHDESSLLNEGAGLLNSHVDLQGKCLLMLMLAAY